MKVKDFHKRNALYLFKRMERLEKIARKRLLNGVPLFKLMKTICERNRIRRYLYKCRLCADATIKIELDADGNEVEYIVKDCGKAKCPYHEYFYNKAVGKENKIDKLLDDFLKRL